jgi:ABC-type transporter Mla subunit MlaD
MSAPTNHWKLGLFVVTAVMVGLLAVLLLGARTLRKETVRYTSYFDEAVTGLEAGSPVTFRGVKIGSVSTIDVAPDRRHVEVQYELGVAVLGRLRLAKREGQNTKMPVTYDLRVQLDSTGLTGTKYIQIDFFDATNTPPPEELPFPVPENYIPATPSTMKNLEQSVVRAVDQLPVIAEAVNELLAKFSVLVTDLHGKNLPEKASATLVSANLLLRDFRVKLDEVKAAQLSGDAHATLVRLQKVLDRVDGEHGLLASVQRATDSMGDMAGGARSVGPELSETLRDVREASVTVRALLEALERDSDMLLKGRAKVAE